MGFAFGRQWRMNDKGFTGDGFLSLIYAKEKVLSFFIHDSLKYSLLK